VSDTHHTRFECANPILRVEEMSAAVRYYVDVLGFEEASWGDEYFTCVNRDKAGIYLSKGGQGHTGSWVWIGVEDVEELYEELKAKGARILHEPANYPWALKIRVEDLDGNVLRIGSDSKRDRPYEAWRP
jgi:uncharacterized glyoxalase superfamily protein PhnB